MPDRQTMIDDLGRLGAYIQRFPDDLEETARKSISHNAWFTESSVKESLMAIADKYLDKKQLESWLESYPEYNVNMRSVGLILAGNIPMVGFHDVLSVFVSGNQSQIKLSDKDKFLIPFLISKLIEFNEAYKSRFNFVEKLTGYDAVIATGSNTSGTYFEKYFSHVPRIIRKNRNAVAILFNDTEESRFVQLGNDIFRYYGLGCRNVSKLYLEKGIDIDRIFKALHNYKDVQQHNKYMNNFDYNNAMYLLNNETFLSNDFVLLKESEEIASRIATVHYSYFEDIDSLSDLLRKQNDKIQCIVTDRKISTLPTVDFGYAQSPGLTDYADGVDTMKFLSSL